jgi:hypothetical protein
VSAQPYSGTATAAARPIAAWAWFAIGVASAVVGLLPWIVTGMRLPLQNLWEVPTAPAEMPLVLLPLSQYAITLVAAIVVVGAAAAGIVARATRARQGARGFAALAVGLYAVQVAAVVQSATTVGGGLRPGRESTFYLAAVVIVAVVSVVIGVLVFSAIARMPRAGALVGLSVAAVASGWWVSALVVPAVSSTAGPQLAVISLVQWLPAILCGVAIAWCGVDSTRRILAAVVAITAVVVGPALATAVTSAAGARVLARYPSEMIEYGVQVFQLAITTPALTLRPLVTAAVVAVAGLAVRSLLRRRRYPAEGAPAGR